jgi:hypothetical protein
MVALLQAIPGVQMDKTSGYWTVVGGCKNVASLPSITFQIGGTDYAMPPQIWTRPVRCHQPLFRHLPRCVES